MTHSEIQAFLTIVKTGSLSAAAEALFVTQPALTRRIQTLEAELGYTLFYRKKGQKGTVLTEKGQIFISVAHRMEDLWKEAQNIQYAEYTDLLKLSAISSVSTYILPGVFQRISAAPANIRVAFQHSHSAEAYSYVADSLADLALISDTRYYPQLETIPLFQEPMVLLANTSVTYKKAVTPADLDPTQEIFLPWNPEYQSWHDYWFGSAAQYRAYTDQMNLMEYFLSWKDTWAVTPYSVASKLQKVPFVSMYELKEPPADRIIYYIKKINRHIRLERPFLLALQEELKELPKVTLLSPVFQASTT